MMGTTVPNDIAKSFGCYVADEKTNKMLHYVEKPEEFISNTINAGASSIAKSPKGIQQMATIALKITHPSFISQSQNQIFNGLPDWVLLDRRRNTKKPLLYYSASANQTHRRNLPQVQVHANPETIKKSQSSLCFDVVIIGAGIIGLTIARQFLLESDLSVAIVDAAVPCAGATGAGQGYIWRINKRPGTDKWELVARSHELWVNLAESLQHLGMDPLQTLGWMKTGSILVGQTEKDSSLLKAKVKQLCDAGLAAEFLSNQDLLLKEPALVLGKEGTAAFLPDDYQLDARRAVAFIEKGNRHFASKGRYAEFYHEPATYLLRSGSNGVVDAVQTSTNTIFSKKAVVMAAGSWSGSLMCDLIRSSNIELDIPVKPRKGHLLVIENFKSLKLNHALMEVGYLNHESASLPSTASDGGPLYDAQTTSVSMTATMDSSGNLVLGSSRQLVGFNTDIDESIINCIWQRAAEFFPALREKSLDELKKSREVRVGLRPYMPDGKPVIGPVPGLSNFYIAAGHEGEGLTMALGTAEMIVDMVLGNSGKVNPQPYTVHRCH